MTNAPSDTLTDLTEKFKHSVVEMARHHAIRHAYIEKPIAYFRAHGLLKDIRDETLREILSGFVILAPALGPSLFMSLSTISPIDPALKEALEPFMTGDVGAKIRNLMLVMMHEHPLFEDLSPKEVADCLNASYFPMGSPLNLMGMFSDPGTFMMVYLMTLANLPHIHAFDFPDAEDETLHEILNVQGGP